MSSSRGLKPTSVCPRTRWWRWEFKDDEYSCLCCYAILFLLNTYQNVSSKRGMVPSKHRSLDKFVCPVIFYERVHHFFIIFTSFSSRLLVLCSFCSSKLYRYTRVRARFVVHNLETIRPLSFTSEQDIFKLSILHLRLDEHIQRTSRFPVHQMTPSLFLRVQQLVRV